MHKVICIGELLIDFMGGHTGAPLKDQTNFLAKPGGAPGNVAATAGSLGGHSAILSAVGQDGFGDLLIETMAQFKVDTTYVYRVPQPTTMAFVSIAANGQRDFIFSRGADGELALSSQEYAMLPQNALLHFGAATSFLEGPLHHTYLELLKLGHKNKSFISFDPNYRSAFWDQRQDDFIEQVWPFISQAHLVKLSDEEALLVTKETDLEQAYKQLLHRSQATFAITLGAEGALIFNAHYRILVPAPKVKVVDTTGAGDAFIGALLYKLSGTEAPVEACKQKDLMQEFAEFANAVAAQVCTEYGALTALKANLY